MRRPTLALERSWSGLPGAFPWTRVLEPAAWVYGLAAARARRAAARERVRIDCGGVIAVGGITVGGSGKSSVTRWLARALTASGGPRVAVLLRGYGANRRGGPAELVPDYAGLDPALRAPRYGDDALAHRAELPRSVAVVVVVDRRASAFAAVEGFGADILLLDDGWEQRGLVFDRLVAVLDPVRPEGNGQLLPAGPLRRPAESLSEASVVAFVLEEGNGLPETTLAFLGRRAPSAARWLFRRRLVGVASPGEDRVEALPGGSRVGLLSGVGAPDRLERFVRAEGLGIAGHAVFPNHAAWSRSDLESAAAALRRAGAQLILMTGKDEARWPRGLATGIPALVIRTQLVPVGPAPDPAALLGPFQPGGPRLADRKSIV